MPEDLSGAERRARAFLIHRARIAGAALLGLAALGWLMGRAAEIW